jgi:hypothetical protein
MRRLTVTVYPDDADGDPPAQATETRVMTAIEHALVGAAVSLGRASAACSDLYTSVKNSRRLSAEVFRKTYLDARKVRRRL